MLMISGTFKSKAKGITKLIKQKDVKTTYEGNGSYRSKVRQIFENSNFACGETLCLPGKWVSETCKGKGWHSLRSSLKTVSDLSAPAVEKWMKWRS